MAKIVAGAGGGGACHRRPGRDRRLRRRPVPARCRPAGLCGSTGGGTPRWTVEPDAGAPSTPNVLKQSGIGAFPWCVKQGTALADG